MNIQIIRKGHNFLAPQDEENMYRLRYSIFRERLGWEVETNNGLEYDEYDEMNPVYVIAKKDASVDGCWRMLPTTGPNMLKDKFPELLGDDPAPECPKTWELSRFAVRSRSTAAYGLTQVPTEMMYRAVTYARAQGVTSFVTVTTVAIERLLRHLGLKPRRLGRPLQIGVERAVALSIDIDDDTQNTLACALREAPSPAPLIH